LSIPFAQAQSVEHAINDATKFKVDELEGRLLTCQRSTLIIVRLDNDQIISGLLLPSQWTGHYNTDPEARVWCSPWLGHVGENLNPTIRNVRYNLPTFTKLVQKLKPHITPPILALEGRKQKLEKLPAHFYHADNPILLQFLGKDPLFNLAQLPVTVRPFDPFEL
jgi:hypothetical protein